MDRIKVKQKAKLKRRKRVRGKVFGTSERPRLSVFRSNNNIYAQIIDDWNQTTLVSASSLNIETKNKFGGNIPAAQEVGKLIAKRALDKGIKKVVFDRGPNLYHGRLHAFAEAARQEGLEF